MARRLAVTEEMKTNLMRTAYNMIIYEALDFTTGLFNARGETLSIGLGLPMFIRGMAETLKAKLAFFGDDIEPGDILVTNDGYITGSHLNHVTLSLPIFHGGKLTAFAVRMAHWLDIGGVLGGGGGGFGPPWERPAEQVREDVRQGYVSLECALEDFGVALDPDTFDIDFAETDRLRGQLAAARAV